MPEKIRCHLCGSEKAQPLFETFDRLRNLPEPYCFVRCETCGLVYVNPRPTWAERAAHYDPAYRGYHRLETEPSLLQRRSMEYGLHKRYQVIASHCHSGKLLDIGCGGGDFAAWMRQQPDWHAYGLERVSAMASAAYRHYRLPVIVGDQLQLALRSASFDVVTLWTVLEHLADPAQGLRECARILKPGGVLVVRTVTTDSWSARAFGPCWVGYDAPRILVVFSRRTLRQFLRQTGFEVLQLSCQFHDYYPFLWSWRNLCQAYIASPAWRAVANRVAGSWLMRLASFPFFALQTLLGGNSFVTGVARRA